jgi:hypothetical protein
MAHASPAPAGLRAETNLAPAADEPEHSAYRRATRLLTAANAGVGVRAAALAQVVPSERLSGTAGDARIRGRAAAYPAAAAGVGAGGGPRHDEAGRAVPCLRTVGAAPAQGPATVSATRSTAFHDGQRGTIILHMGAARFSPDAQRDSTPAATASAIASRRCASTRTTSAIQRSRPRARARASCPRRPAAPPGSAPRASARESPSATTPREIWEVAQCLDPA